MSLIDEALKRARLEAAQRAAESEGLPYPTIPRHLAPHRRRGWLGPLVIAIAVLAGVLGGVLLATRGGPPTERMAALGGDPPTAGPATGSLPAGPPEGARPMGPAEAASGSRPAEEAAPGPAEPAPRVDEPTPATAADPAVRAAPPAPAPPRSQPTRRPESRREAAEAPPAATAPAESAPLAGGRQASPSEPESGAPSAATPLPSSPARRPPQRRPTPPLAEPSATTGPPVEAPAPERPEPTAAASGTKAMTDPDSGVLLVLPERPEPAGAAAGADGAAEAVESFAQEVPLPGGGAIELGGIAWSETGPFALINGRVVGPGAVVEGFTLAGIQPGHVMLSGNGRRIRLTLQ